MFCGYFPYESKLMEFITEKVGQGENTGFSAFLPAQGYFVETSSYVSLELGECWYVVNFLPHNPDF